MVAFVLSVLYLLFRWTDEKGRELQAQEYVAQKSAERAEQARRAAMMKRVTWALKQAKYQKERAEAASLRDE